MTKNKLAKLVAKSASAKSVAPVPLLTFNEDKSALSFMSGQGAPGQLAAELEEFNNSKWTAGQQAAFGQIPFPPVLSSKFVANPVTINDVPQNPGSTTTQNAVNNYFATVNHAAFMDPSSDSNYQASLAMPDLDELDVLLPYVPAISPEDLFLPEEDTYNTEVLRQAALNEGFKDGLNDFFDFDLFE